MSIKEILAKREEGFTLIEIVFVLAIAALIIVIVFLAVQGARNAASDQARKDWAGRLAAACDKWAGDATNGVTGGLGGCAIAENLGQAISKTAGTPPTAGGAALTTTGGGSPSPSNASVGATDVQIVLSNGVTYKAAF